MNNNNTIVYVKVPGPRPPNFVNPTPFEWNSQKDNQLWDYISNVDTKKVAIDWEELCASLGAPSYFLQKRSRQLFSTHLHLLKQQLAEKKKILHPDKTVSSLQRVRSIENSTSIESPFVHGSVAVETDSDIPDYASESNYIVPESIHSKDGIDEKVLQQMQTSKLLDFDAPGRVSSSTLSDDALVTAGDKIDNHQKNDDKNNEERNNTPVEDEDDDDLSSNLSVSKSALEEALMARLNF